MTTRTAAFGAALGVLALAGCGRAPHDDPHAAGRAAAPHVAPAAGGTGASAGVVVEAPWIRLPPPPATVAAGYLRVLSVEDDRLLAVESDAAGRIEIHEMRETDGMMRMRELADGLPLAAGRRVDLAPGGYHLMLMAPRADLAPGREVEATLVFARAGRVPVRFEVRAAAPGEGGHGADAAHGGP